MDNPKIIFMGTPHFAVPTMEALHEKYGLDAVVTVPDKKQGRGRKIIPSPVKRKAEEFGVQVLQPKSLKDEYFQKKIEELEPDIICVVAFKILPKEIFNAAKIASFNIHGSILPKYRGAAPINHAIINREKKSGVTSFILKEKVDTGNILITKEINIHEDMTAGELHDALMPLSAEAAVETVGLLVSGDYETIEQDESKATPAPKIFREDCKIDFNKEAADVKAFLLGMNPIPGAWCYLDDKILKLFRCNISESKNLKPGEYIIEDNNFYIQTADKSLEITELQLEGKKAMKTVDFLAGFRGDNKGKLK